jgi:ATP-binding cassette subfamily B protein
VRVNLRQYADLLGKYLAPQWARVLQLGILIILSLGLQLIKPQILRSFIDAVSGAAEGNLLRIALFFMAAALANSLVTALSRYVSEDVGWTATNMLRRDLMAHCLNLDMSFHKAYTPGEMIERVDGDVNKLAGFFSQFIMGIAVNVLLMVGVLAMLFREDWRVGVALGIFSVVAVLALTALRDVAVPYWTAERQQSGMFYGFLTEHLSGTVDIRSNGAVGYVMNRFYSRLREWLPAVRKAYLANVSMWAASIMTFTVGNAIAFGFSAWLWYQGSITMGTVYLIVHYTELLRRPINQIRTQLQELQRAGAGITRLNAMLGRSSLIQDGPGLTLPQGPLGVNFSRVTFGYEEDQPILRDVSFSLAPGRVVGLLGRTGSGKTTLARLLLRLYDPTSGEVILGGARLQDMTVRQLRQKVTMVTQDVQLFEASVRDNLTFFDRGIADTHIVSVLNDLGLGPWYARLPGGLDTVIGQNGIGLSAGEAQLLAFARCFLADPALVVMDEASSRLDPATEQLIERAIDKLLVGRTAVIIAHRLDTVERADDILILEQGAVVEHGDRIELSGNPASRFSALLSAGMKELLV